MTQIKLKWLDHDARTPLADASGRVTIEPYARRAVDDAILTATPFTVQVDGERIIVLPPSPAGTAYKFTWNSLLDEPWDEYVVVPESDAIVNYTDLQQVAPESLDPIATPDPEWWARINDALTGISVRDGKIYAYTWAGSEEYAGDLATGPAGPEGPAGRDGRDGKDGRDGVDGLQGPKGDAGPQGLKGDTGAQGPAGKDGLQGPNGDTGPAGERGPQGLQGIKGDTGAAGLQGPKGDKGDKGATGDRGLQGIQGPAGKDGAQGLKGDKGDTGDSAYQAAVKKGFTGTEQEWLDSLKAEGGEGTIGPKGDKGDTGPQGPEGPAGKDGKDGAQGLQGLQGPKGDKGDKGDTGAEGPKGATGAKGDTGLKGDRGDVGKDGPQGVKGDQGDSAYTVAVKNGYVGTEQEWLSSLKAEAGENSLPEDVLLLKHDLIGQNQFSFETTAKANTRVGQANEGSYVNASPITDGTGTYTVYASRLYPVAPGESIHAINMRSMRRTIPTYNSTWRYYTGSTTTAVNNQSFTYKNNSQTETHFVSFDTVVKDNAAPPQSQVMYGTVSRPYTAPEYSEKPIVVDFTGLKVDMAFITDDLNEIRSDAYGINDVATTSFDYAYNINTTTSSNPGSTFSAYTASPRRPGRSMYVVFKNGVNTTRFHNTIKQLGYPLPGTTMNVALILYLGTNEHLLVWLTQPSIQSGTGRPDIPATTGGMITGSEPVGHKYYSTDGAGVGAWEWMKTGVSTWKVINGDTGWYSLSGIESLKTAVMEGWNPDVDVFEYRIVNNEIHWRFQVRSGNIDGTGGKRTQGVFGDSDVMALFNESFLLQIMVISNSGMTKFGRFRYGVNASTGTGFLNIIFALPMSVAEGISATCSYPLDKFPTVLPGVKK